jgi:hypothetical protein
MASSTHYNWVLMKDIVGNKPLFGLLGRIANTLFIKIKLTEIFDSRTKAFENLFLS